MKFLVVGDLHIGVGSDDKWQENIRKELMTQVIEYAKSNNIKRLVFLGDVFDDRRAITHRSLELNREIIIEPIQQNNLEAIMIIGNHDAMYKNTLKPNAITEVFGKLDNFHVVESAETIMFGDTPIDFISWICNDNIEEILAHIQTTKAKYAFGHFELVGFDYYKGIKAKHGQDPQFLSKYKEFWSGHYHTINGPYLGTPFTITNNDVNEMRGFWLFDTDNMSRPLIIPNNKIWHRRFSYPMDASMREDYSLDISEFENCRVTIDLNDQPDSFFNELESKLESIVDRLEVKNNYVIQNVIDTQNKIDNDIKADGGPLELADENINQNDLINEDDKDIIKKMLNELYINAITKMSEV